MVFVAYKHAIIFATVILGSYAMVRGISCYAGHYYNEFVITKMISDGLYIDPMYWCYPAGFVVMCVIGTLVQYRSKRKEDREEWDKENGSIQYR
jgi:hypothetical protein